MEQTKRQQQKLLTKQRISDTAYGLYAADGFATPTSIIAQRAGLSHGAIFVHFPTKESLQLYVLERFAEAAGNKLHQLSAAGNDITLLLHAHLSVLQEYEPFYKRLITELPFLPEATRTILLALQSTISLHFCSAIESGQQSGKIKGLPLHIIFNTWIGLIHYYLQNSDLFAPGESVLASRRDELIDSFITLISN